MRSNFAHLALAGFLVQCNLVEGSVLLRSAHLQTRVYTELDGVFEEDTKQGTMLPVDLDVATNQNNTNPALLVEIWSLSEQNLVIGNNNFLSLGSFTTDYLETFPNPFDQMGYFPHAVFESHSNLSIAFSVKNHSTNAEIWFSQEPFGFSGDAERFASYELVDLESDEIIASGDSAMPVDILLGEGSYRLAAEWNQTAEVSADINLGVWTAAAANELSVEFDRRVFVVPEANSFAVWSLLGLVTVGTAQLTWERRRRSRQVIILIQPKGYSMAVFYQLHKTLELISGNACWYTACPVV